MPPKGKGAAAAVPPVKVAAPVVKPVVTDKYRLLILSFDDAWCMHRAHVCSYATMVVGLFKGTVF